jgi:hypothetical protein
VDGVVEGFGQVARKLCLRLLIVFDRLASIEPGAPDILRYFSLALSRSLTSSDSIVCFTICLFISRPS